MQLNIFVYSSTHGGTTAAFCFSSTSQLSAIGLKVRPLPPKNVLKLQTNRNVVQCESGLGPGLLVGQNLVYRFGA